jgi:aspartyl-tRNA(Asn)/glutamyl-tRNA(Gln) amidotransferase subunit C
LEFKDEELDRFTMQLENILGYIGQLNELDTRDVKPTYHVLELSTPLRKDVVSPWLSLEEAMENAPLREDEFFAVPKVIGD